ncbi:hypothetical protein [Frigidibacter oleivorans]|uniref:hypothetical protein n=1 Tax=Frigidibacter oleivorans TaxID=2487129 RepID=UPI000F8D4178|nr:hypothetical protein [Frigidibacter oleivorans]
MTLSLAIVVPDTPDAHAKGCICPGTDHQSSLAHEILLACGGLFFAPDCPVHRHAVQAEVQRMFGRHQ